jgi:deoxyguanosine kinase
MSKFIAIEGVIGVGKTTLARLLQPHFGGTVLLEVFEENPFLADFYADRQRYAFQTQLFFLLSRYHQQKQAVAAGLAQGNLIADYTFAKDELFAWLNLKDDELAMYGRVHSALSEKMRHPDLLVYLKAKHETIMQRIAQRDRPYERDMDPHYIRDLAAAYEAWLANLPDIPVLTLDVTELDFLSRPEDVQVVAGAIGAALAQQQSSLRTEPTESAKGVGVSLPPLPQGAFLKYQQFQQNFDVQKGFTQDAYVNFLGLVEEVGELATLLNKAKVLGQGGRGENTVPPLTPSPHRAQLSGELADILAYTLKLANDLEIDLEQAYLEKMRENINRHW